MTTEAQKRAKKKWVKKNPDLVKVYTYRWIDKNPDKYKENYEKQNKKRQDRIKSDPDYCEKNKQHDHDYYLKKKAEALNAQTS